MENIAKEIGFEFSKEQYTQLTGLSKHYGKVRYPDFARQDYNTKEKVKPIMRKAKETYLWIQEKLKNH